jgi:hypothetical protein
MRLSGGGIPSHVSPSRVDYEGWVCCLDGRALFVEEVKESWDGRGLSLFSEVKSEQVIQRESSMKRKERQDAHPSSNTRYKSQKRGSNDFSW